MNVFGYFEFTWKHPVRSIKYFFKALRWSGQRVKKGYCDWDLMDIDTWFSELMPRMLREYKTSIWEEQHPVLPEFFDEYYALFIENSGMSKEEFNEALYSYETHDEYTKGVKKEIFDWLPNALLSSRGIWAVLKRTFSKPILNVPRME